MKKHITDNESDSLVVEEITLDKLGNRPHVSTEIQHLQKETAERKKHPEEDMTSAAMAEALSQVSEWKQSPSYLKKHKHLIANIVPAADLMIFEMSADHSVAKINWSSLPQRLKEVFEEIIYSLPLTETSNRTDDGCYTFSYSDDEFDIAVISIVIEGKAALFYKNAEISEF